MVEPGRAISVAGRTCCPLRVRTAAVLLIVANLGTVFVVAPQHARPRPTAPAAGGVSGAAVR